jgi:hypothetical protein
MLYFVILSLIVILLVACVLELWMHVSSLSSNLGAFVMFRLMRVGGVVEIGC